jgi:hypothetical protein
MRTPFIAYQRILYTPTDADFSKITTGISRPQQPGAELLPKQRGNGQSGRLSGAGSVGNDKIAGQKGIGSPVAGRRL